jgi:capsular polysaccharide biosynthesis protein
VQKQHLHKEDGTFASRFKMAFRQISMIQILLQNKRTVLLAFLISSALAYAICYFIIVPKYQSTAVIFPPNTHANIHLVSAGMRFGYDKEIGEHIEIINSIKVREKIIASFDLMHHYKVDSTAPFAWEDLQDIYDQNISISRTVNKSIHILVKDSDPAIAAKIANTIVIESDNHKSDLVKENVELAMLSAKNAYLAKTATVQLMTDSLEQLRLAGESVWNYGEERKSSRFSTYEILYRKEIDRFLFLKNKYEELQTIYDEAIPRSYKVSEAVISSKPIYPKKLWASAISGLLTVLLYLGFLKFKALNS